MPRLKAEEGMTAKEPKESFWIMETLVDDGNIYIYICLPNTHQTKNGCICGM